MYPHLKYLTDLALKRSDTSALVVPGGCISANKFFRGKLS